MSAISDEELARQHLAGHRDAFRQLVMRYQARLVTLLYRYTGDQGRAEEIGQDVFLKLYRALPRLDVSQPLRPYLYRIAVNAAHDWARRGGPWAAALGSFDDEADAESADSIQVDQVNERLTLEDAVMRLPLIYREVVSLHYGAGLAYSQIAQTLSISEETVRTRLRRALTLLRDWLREENEGGK